MPSYTHTDSGRLLIINRIQTNLMSNVIIHCLNINSIILTGIYIFCSIISLGHTFFVTYTHDCDTHCHAIYASTSFTHSFVLSHIPPAWPPVKHSQMRWKSIYLCSITKQPFKDFRWHTLLQQIWITVKHSASLIIVPTCIQILYNENNTMLWNCYFSSIKWHNKTVCQLYTK